MNGMQPSVSLFTNDEECKDPSVLASRKLSRPELATKKPHVTINVKLNRIKEMKDKEEDGSKGRELSTSTSLRRPESELTEEQRILELTRR